LAIQCRAFLPAPGEPYPDGDLIVAPYRENRTEIGLRAALAPMVGRLETDGADIVEVGDADESSPYAVGVNPQARYLDFSEGGSFAILWLSPFLRENYRLQDENDTLLKRLKAVGIPIREVPLATYLDGAAFSPYGSNNELLKGRLRAFRERMDIHVLQGLSAEFDGDTFEAVLDPHSRQLFLACRDPEGKPRLVANLSRHAFDRKHAVGESEPETFSDSRAAWLEERSKPTR
jgi:hypothetical protein